MSEAFDERYADSHARPVAGKRAKKARKPKGKQASRGRRKGGAKASQARAQVARELAVSSWRRVALGGFLLLICTVLGVQIAQQSQEMRSVYTQLQQDQLAKDALLAERSRLLIERGALQSYNSVERLAKEKLSMQFPETINRVAEDAR